MLSDISELDTSIERKKEPYSLPLSSSLILNVQYRDVLSDEVNIASFLRTRRRFNTPSGSLKETARAWRMRIRHLPALRPPRGVGDGGT